MSFLNLINHALKLIPNKYRGIILDLFKQFTNASVKRLIVNSI